MDDIQTNETQRPDISEVAEKSEKKGKKDWFLPISIMIAAVLIAGAVIYSKGMKGVEPNPAESSGQTKKAIALSANEKILGEDSAQLVMLEYSDYECPYCAKFYAETRPFLVESYIKSGKMKAVFRPMAFHQASAYLINAVACASDQGKYWEMHDFVFDQEAGGVSPDEATLLGQAKSLGLDESAFSQCLKDESRAEEIINKTREYSETGFQATPISVIAEESKLPANIDPSYLINQMQAGQSVVSLADGVVAIIGAQPLSVYQSEIDKLLK